MTEQISAENSLPGETAPSEPAGDALPQLPDVPVLHDRSGSQRNEPMTATGKLADMLVRSGISVATAESLTGGALAAELVRVPGISTIYNGGVVAYSYDVKSNLLGVERDLLLTRGAVNDEVALQMARGVREACRVEDVPADVGVATTGVAGPEPSDGEPAGIVYVGLATLWGERAFRLDFTSLVRADDPVGSRQRIRFATVEAAIYQLTEYLVAQANG